MNNWPNHFESTLTSSSHANFRLDIFHSKTLLCSFCGREKSLKADTICKKILH